MDGIKKWIGCLLVLAILAVGPQFCGGAAAIAIAENGVAMTVAANGVVTLQPEMVDPADVPMRANLNADEDYFKLVQLADLSRAQRQALEKMYGLVPELKNLPSMGVYKEETENVWNIWLSDAQDLENIEIHSANAHLTFDTNTWELLCYSFNNPAWASKEEPSRQFATKKADAFIEQLLGRKALQRDDTSFGGMGGTSIDEDGNEISWWAASVHYYPLINGLPFINDITSVSVDIVGNIVGYQRYNNGGFSVSGRAVDPSLFLHPDQAVITPAAARKILTNEITMELIYLPGGSPFSDRDEPRLVYTPQSIPAYIDAMTGGDPNSLGDMHIQQKHIVLSGRGDTLLARDQKEAELLLQRRFGVDLAEMVCAEINERFIAHEDVVYHQWNADLDWEQPGADEKWRSINLGILRSTGEVVSFYVNERNESQLQTEISREEALVIATNLVERALPKGDKEMHLSIYDHSFGGAPDWVDPDFNIHDGWYPLDEISFSFVPTHKGIQLPYGYNVTVNMNTGKVTSYTNNNQFTGNTDWLDADLAIPAEKAKAEFLKGLKLQQVYYQPNWYGQYAPAPLLVYTIDYSSVEYLIDAITGKGITFDSIRE